jgi:hypothetical protein
MTYLGNKFLYPVVNQSEFFKEFKNTYSKKSKKIKLIVKSLTLLDACIDSEGIFIPGKSTIIVLADSVSDLKYLSALINSKLMFFFLSQKYPSSSYNQGINFTSDMVNSLPIPNPSEKIKNTLIDYVNKIFPIQQKLYSEQDIKKSERLKIESEAIEREINNEVFKLYEFTKEEVKIVEESMK